MARPRTGAVGRSWRGPDRPRPRWLAAFVTAPVALVSALVTACGSAPVDLGGVRDDAGAIVEAGPLAIDRIEVGDCFDHVVAGDLGREVLPAGSAGSGAVDAPAAAAIVTAPEVAIVPAVPCPAPHDHETYHLGVLGEGEFPGAPAVERRVFEQCLVAFEDFVGTPYEVSTLEIAYLFPSAANWEDGDRGYVCAVFDLNDDKLEGTVRDAGR